MVVCRVYNVSPTQVETMPVTLNPLATIVMPDSFTNMHCNSFNFTNIFYAEGDEFPLFIVSSGESDTRYYIGRIVHGDTWSIEHIKYVDIDLTSLKNAGYLDLLTSGNMAMDVKRGLLVHYTGVKGNTNKRKTLALTGFRLPDIVSPAILL